MRIIAAVVNEQEETKLTEELESFSVFDVAPFIDLVSIGGFSLKGDFNGDGEVNLLDVASFVDALSGG